MQPAKVQNDVSSWSRNQIPVCPAFSKRGNVLLEMTSFEEDIFDPMTES